MPELERRLLVTSAGVRWPTVIRRGGKTDATDAPATEAPPRPDAVLTCCAWEAQISRVSVGSGVEVRGAGVGRERGVDETARAGRTGLDLVTAFPQPVERLRVAERERCLQPISVLRLREVQHPVDKAGPGTGEEGDRPGRVTTRG